MGDCGAFSRMASAKGALGADSEDGSFRDTGGATGGSQMHGDAPQPPGSSRTYALDDLDTVATVGESRLTSLSKYTFKTHMDGYSSFLQNKNVLLGLLRIQVGFSFFFILIMHTDRVAGLNCPLGYQSLSKKYYMTGHTGANFLFFLALALLTNPASVMV